MTRAESARKWLVQTALSYLGTPYLWGGDDPSGFDCSGFVLECLKSAGLVSGQTDCTADQLLRTLKGEIIPTPVEEALLFTLDLTGRAVHVVICLDQWFQIGASGGTSATIDLISAWRDNAFVRIRPIHLDPIRQKILLSAFE